MIFEEPGKVTTFYSYKGGTGRSMALANVACILAKLQGGQVLMIDWDLEAPGLHRFFRKRIKEELNIMDNSAIDEKPGLIDLFYDLKKILDNYDVITQENIIKAFDELNFDRFVLHTNIPSLYLIKAGRFDAHYDARVNGFNWSKFYEDFPEVFRNLALYLSKKYKHILVDSRTGIADISGITTTLIPDRLVAVFTPNRQSLIGVIDRMNKALEYRKQSNDLRPLIIFPLPSRIEASEPDLREIWRNGAPDQDILGYQAEFEKFFKSAYDISKCSLKDYFDEVQIQHVPHYSYGEEIAALVEESQDRLSLTNSYENFAKKIVDLQAPWTYFHSIIPHQIPPPPRDFKGRENEIRDILSNFEKGATITGLRGMGGVGKTALALVLADKIKNKFPDGQIFIEMRGTSTNPDLPPLTPDEVMIHVIRAFNPADKLPENSNELRGLYHSILAGKRVLLLLDNAANSEQVEPLLPPRGCSVLITSRIRFTLPGLAEKDLDILPLDKARELLLDIAPRIGDRADELAKLCGYLPLALRNAAKALAERTDLGVSEYEQRLRNKMERLELVKASFSTSYDLLSPGRKRQWRRLSVFPADFDRSAATAVLKMAPGPSAEALSDLVRWSLLDYVQLTDSKDGRYKLHDLARIFAESFLEPDEAIDSQQKHAKHFLKVLFKASKLYEKGRNNIFDGLELFDREWANIKVGHAWIRNRIKNHRKLTKSDSKTVMEMASSYANDGAIIIDLRLHPREKIGWFETGLIASRVLKIRNHEGVHLGNLGLAYSALGETHKAIEYYEQALAISHEIGDRRNEGNRLGNLGSACADLGETRKAIEYFKQALKIAREIGDRRGEGSWVGSLGRAYSDLGETRKAIEHYEQALAISREIGDKRNEGAWMGNLGSAHSDLGEKRKAIEHYEQALVISREIGDKKNEGAWVGGLGEAYADLGENRKAIEYYEQALKISREIGNKRGEGIWLGNLGAAYSYLSETRKAIEHYEQALAISREIGDKRNEGAWVGGLGMACADLGETRKAIKYYEQALKISREIGNKRGEGIWLGGLGLAYSCLGESRKTIEHYEQTLKIFREIGDRRNEGASLGLLGRGYFDLGETRKAVEYFEQALKVSRETGDRRGEGIWLGDMGCAFFYLSEIRKAIEYHEHAMVIARGIEDLMLEGEILSNLGRDYLGLNESAKAIDYCQQSLDIVCRIQYPRIEGEALCNLGKVYADTGEAEKSIDYCSQALKIFRKIEYRCGEGDALFCKSLALSELGQCQQAIDSAKAALQIFEQIESPHAKEVLQKLAEWQASIPQEN